MLLSVFASSAFAVQNHPSTDGETNLSSIQTYDGMIKELEALEERSKGKLEVFTLADKNYAYTQSEQGRDLYVAKVGNGPKKVWVQGRIHGNEPYGTESILQLIKQYTSNKSPETRELLDELTIYFAPMYNPDGSEMNIRHTILQDGSNRRIDLNRDWANEDLNGFEAVESKAWYEFWTDIQPDYALDIHHQGTKTDSETDQAITMSLGISLAPGGPTFGETDDPKLQLYEDLTRQMQVHVYDELNGYGFTNIDRYVVGSKSSGFLEIDIIGGVVSAMMIGLDYEGLNVDGHSNPAIFFETSGNTSNGSLGQRGRGHNIRQNTQGIDELLNGLANGEVYNADPERWNDIPHEDTIGYLTDHSGFVPSGY